MNTALTNNIEISFFFQGEAIEAICVTKDEDYFTIEFGLLKMHSQTIPVS